MGWQGRGGGGGDERGGVEEKERVSTVHVLVGRRKMGPCGCEVGGAGGHWRSDQL